MTTPEADARHSRQSKLAEQVYLVQV